MTLDETIKIAKLLEKHGADSLQITQPLLPQFYAYENNEKNPLIDAADKIISEVDIPVILGGGLRNQKQINNILNSTDIDFVSMHKPFVADPSFLVDWKIEGNGESFCQTCYNCLSKRTSTCHLKPCSPEYYK